MDSWILGRRWNVVQTAPNSESLAATSAREMGWQVFWPRYREKRAQSHRKPVEAILPYLPGYIFTADNRFLSRWDLAKAKGIAAVLKMGMEYVMVDDTDPVMRTLLKMTDMNGFVAREEARKPITMFKSQETVRLKNCPFELFNAVIDMIDESRDGAWVWLNMFGGKSRVHVNYDQLEKVR